MMSFFIFCAIFLALFGILATYRQSPNSSPQSAQVETPPKGGVFFRTPAPRVRAALFFRQKKQASTSFRLAIASLWPALLVFSRLKRQASTEAATLVCWPSLDRRNKQACFFQDDGPGIQARQVPGPAGTVLERTDKQASVLGRRTKDSSTKKGYPKIALSH